MGKIKAFYASLPTWVQGIIVAAEGGFIGFLVQWASDPEPLCFSRSCLRHFIGAAAGATVISVRNWLKQSPLPQAREVWTDEQRDEQRAIKVSGGMVK